jgi:hypothetical protein
MALTLRYSESGLAKGLSRLAERAGAVILAYAGTKAGIIESDMKQDRPWTDRTGMAKSRLSARVSQPQSNIVRITLAHGVDYGVYLEGFKPDGTVMKRYASGVAGELGSEKKFAIVGPSVRKFAPEVVEDLQGIMGEMT